MNTWICGNCEKEHRNGGDYPSACPHCGSQYGFYAKYDPGRIHYSRFTFTPYSGSSDWAYNANQSMKAAAQDAFVNKR